MLNGKQSLGVMAATDPKLRGVLERLDIDYVTCGDATLEDAAAAAGLSVPEIETELEREKAADERRAVSNGSLTITLDKLRREHRLAISDVLWRIAMLFDRIRDHTLVDDPKWHALRTRFEALVAKFATHVEREDSIIYPHIAGMESAWIRSKEPPPPLEGGLRRVVASVYLQHAGMNSDLKAMRDDRAHLVCKSGHEACRHLFESLAALEDQLHETMNLENFVIYPAAIALEDQLYGAAAATPA